ncbi:MAG: ATP-binding protein [Dehalococcoidia bacterium]|nr:ATP-binding protein [Dehalococcoidia bacterium]
MFRTTIRLRLTLLYGGLFLLAGVLLIGATQYLLRERLDDAVPSPEARVAAAFGNRLQRFERLPAPQQARTNDGRTIRQFLVDEREELEAEIMEEQLVQSSFALGLVAMVALAFGWVLAGRTLSPIHRITETARRASERNLDERVAISGPKDELKELADTFDNMLARLQRAFAAQRTFGANASHELRTPVTSLRTEAEVRLQHSGITDEEQRFAESVLATSEQAEHIIDSLLALARSESALIDREAVDLADVTGDVAGELAEVADREGLDFSIELGSAPVLGDRSLLQRLATNLIENAMRHNVANGWVRARTAQETDDAVLEVENTGPPVTDTDLATLFEPFRRSRRSGGHGHGLGLAIVKAIVDAHGGTIDAQARPGGGLAITVRLPASNAV